MFAAGLAGCEFLGLNSMSLRVLGFLAYELSGGNESYIEQLVRETERVTMDNVMIFFMVGIL